MVDKTTGTWGVVLYRESGRSSTIEFILIFYTLILESRKFMNGFSRLCNFVVDTIEGLIYLFSFLVGVFIITGLILQFLGKL